MGGLGGWKNRRGGEGRGERWSAIPTMPYSYTKTQTGRARIMYRPRNDHYDNIMIYIIDIK